MMQDNTISGPMETGSLPAGPILHTVIKKWVGYDILKYSNV